MYLYCTIHREEKKRRGARGKKGKGRGGGMLRWVSRGFVGLVDVYLRDENGWIVLLVTA